MGNLGRLLAVILALGALQGEEQTPAADPTDALPAYARAIAVTGSCSLAASGVMAAFLQAAQVPFLRSQPGITMYLSFPSSAGVIDRLFSGGGVVGATSRPLSGAERRSLERRREAPVEEFVVGRDGLLVIVHRQNPLPGISLDQLDGIYSDALLRGGAPASVWGDLGLGGAWQADPIVPWGGAAGWGTTLSFEALVCHGAPAKATVHTATIEKGIPQAVADRQNAIGYTTRSADCSTVRVLPVATAPGAPFVACTPVTLTDGSYPLGRALYVYLVMDPRHPEFLSGREFVRFILSREGQRIVTAAGFAPLDARQSRRSLARLSGAAAGELSR